MGIFPLMDEREIQAKLAELRRLETESEIVEFKGAINDNYSTSDVGKYFSALSNEANLSGADSAWLVFGVQDKTFEVGK